MLLSAGRFRATRRAAVALDAFEVLGGNRTWHGHQCSPRVRTAPRQTHRNSAVGRCWLVCCTPGNLLEEPLGAWRRHSDSVSATCGCGADAGASGEDMWGMPQGMGGGRAGARMKLPCPSPRASTAVPHSPCCSAKFHMLGAGSGVANTTSIARPTNKVSRAAFSNHGQENSGRLVRPKFR